MDEEGQTPVSAPDCVYLSFFLWFQMYETRTWKTILLKGKMSNLMLNALSRRYVHQIYRAASNVCRNCDVKHRELTRQGKSVWPTFTNKQTKLCEGSLLFLLAWGVAGGGGFLRSSSQQSTREGKMGGK
jgi:hypothetical protein